MIEWAEKAGCLLGISPAIMGLTICAAGTSAPDALVSLHVAANGQGRMAISNVFGSNVFDILFALGLPWVIETTFVGEVVPVDKDDIGRAVFILFGLLVIFLVTLAAQRMWQREMVGKFYLVLYAVLLVYFFLHDYSVVPF
jgi:Ca2+/Na+ antiporter